MRRTLWLAATTITVLALAACSGGENASDARCAEGTQLSNNTCVPVITCGPDQTLINNLCTADGGGENVTCGAGTADNGSGVCVPNDTSCGEGTTWTDGVCVGEGSGNGAEDVDCGPGTELSEDETMCLVVTDMVCGDGAVLETDTNTCVPLCGPGLVYDMTTEDCVSECGDGTVFSDADGVCEPECQGTEYYVDGMGCVDVPVCAAGTMADETTGECEAYPFDEVSLDTICGQRAINWCDNLLDCCGSYGGRYTPRLGRRGGSAPKGLDSDDFHLDEAGCVARELEFCEIDMGVAVLRELIEQGLVEADDTGVQEFVDFYTYESPSCVIPDDDEDVLQNWDPITQFDNRELLLVGNLTTPLLPNDAECELGINLGVNVCASGLCAFRDDNPDDSVEARYLCTPRIGETTWDGMTGDPLDEELCRDGVEPPADRSTWCEEGLRCQGLFFTASDVEEPHFFCAPDIGPFERCIEFDEPNPCADGFVCRFEDNMNPEVPNVPICVPLGEVDDICAPSATYDTCDASTYCDGLNSVCVARVSENTTCATDSECEAGLVCRPLSGWEFDLGEDVGRVCQRPLAAGATCSAIVANSSWCGANRWCSDEANNCDEPVATCMGASGPVGNCLAGGAVGASCDLCGKNYDNPFTGCRQNLNCLYDYDMGGNVTTACFDGFSICRFIGEELDEYDADVCEAL